MWSDQSVNTDKEYVKVSVARSQTANYRTAVAQHTLRPLPYSLTIDRSRKADLIVSTDNAYESHLEWWGGSYHWVPNQPLTTVKTVWKNDWMSDNTSSFLNIQSKVQVEIDEYYKNRDNKILSKLKGQSLPLMMAWKERRETGELLLGAAQRIVDACKVIRHPKQFVRRLYKDYKGKSSGSVRLKVMERRAQKQMAYFLKNKKWPPHRGPRVGDLFLQYQFAWRPLVMDVQDALDASIKTEKRLCGGSAKVGYKKSGTVTAVGGRSCNELNLKCEYSLYGHEKLFWSVDSIGLMAMSQIQGLPETIWDAVPYSFVVDWFIGIGDYLELRNATLGLSLDHGYRSIVLEKRYTSEPGGTKIVNRTPYTALTAWPERYQFSFQRQILSSFPDPHLATDFSMPSSRLHMAEAAALVKQALDRKL